ncbi:MAG: type II toxin-antitoxin system PemK/MazF family toxin [Candidatus Rokubacteria bacterium]|nr:type II toxin-antitoxin system PemK/MazF family toxin [Candidatus Rokubacteria bacterium]
MKRGDIFWAELRPRSGSEQRGRRPVIVMSNDGFNLTPAWRSVIVVPVTTSEAQARRGPTAVALAAGVGGLPRPGVAVCHQVTTLDRAKLTERLGTLSPSALAAVEGGLKAALDIP